MGVYAITGGSGGIGLRVISQLEKQGHEDNQYRLENRRYPGPTFLFQKDGRK